VYHPNIQLHTKMSPVQKGATVLVTGASGFISAHTVEALLQHGYKVVGTVRDEKKGQYLENLFKGKGDFSYVIVEDIGQDNAFDEAVKNVDAVLHMASPFHFEADDPQELFVPAVNGTLGVLKSVQKNNPKVQRIVITSSVAAIVSSNIKGPHTFTEKDWNQVSIPECEKKGKEASNQDKYRASKTLAEQAFWKYIKDEKPNWDGATINPPMVLGPIIHQCDSIDKLNTSVKMFSDWMLGKKKQEDLPAAGMNWVDVRDCALAHVRALEVKEAGGERFICGNGAFSGNDFCVILNNLYPDNKGVPKGDPSAREKLNADATVHDGSKCAKTLGVKYTNLEDCVKDMSESLKSRFNV